MRHHQYNSRYVFVKAPIAFDKYTDRSFLQYCLGATMYMPGTKDFAQALLDRKHPGLTSMVMCFEDACPEQDVLTAEFNSIHMLDTLKEAELKGLLKYENVPLLFFRVRNPDQFLHFSRQLRREHIRYLTGFVFPKFNSANGDLYMNHLVDLNNRFGEVLYGMPILEDTRIAHKETRLLELVAVKRICDSHRNLILNIRVGGTDFSSCFGVRRGVNYTIYDILTVADCLMDILNVFTRHNDYTVSGPVWEYFRVNKSMKTIENLPKIDLQKTILKRKAIVDDAVDGLMRELVLDQANGFMGKTCIHPSHLPYINGMLAVTKDEYADAYQIMHTKSGVVKGTRGMNEIGPHKAWAERIMMRADAYGVIENEEEYFNLFGS